MLDIRRRLLASVLPHTWAAGRLWLQALELEFGNLFRIFVHCYLPTIFLSVQSMLFPRVLTLTVTVETRRDSGSSVVLHLCAGGVFVLSNVQLFLPWKNMPKITNLWNETRSWLKRARGPHPQRRPRLSVFPSGCPENPARPAASVARRSPPRSRPLVRPRWTGASWLALGTFHGYLGRSFEGLCKEKGRSPITHGKCQWTTRMRQRCTCDGLAAEFLWMTSLICYFDVKLQMGWMSFTGR